jgi:hypothetical protein
VFNGCKNNNTLIISKDVRAKARRAKALVAHTNSLAHPRASQPTWGRGGEGIGAKSKSNKVDDTPITKNKATTYICVRKRCFA